MTAKTSDEVINRFLERVASGEAVTRVCKDKDMPSWVTVSTRIAADPAFEAQYRLALEFRGMVLADQLDEIKRGAMTGQIDPQSGRLAADILKWQAARMTPKVYGDRQQVDVAAVEGGSYLDVLQTVNQAIADKRAKQVSDNRENTQPDKLHARATEVNQISVNSEMPKKQANKRKKGKKLSTGS